MHDIELYSKLMSRAFATPKGCIETNWSLSAGYPRFTYPGRRREIWRGHRAMWYSINGPIPKDRIICHTCNNKRCIYIHHLYLGTHKTNALDSINDGAGYIGTRNGSAKLDNWKIIMIRSLISAGFYKQITLARHYKVSIGTISNIINRVTWTHI